MKIFCKTIGNSLFHPYIANMNNIFKDTEFSLHHGECVSVMSSLPDDYVDVVFADPPYMLSNGWNYLSIW